MAQGYLSIILHAHLPFVRYPKNDSILPEHWLFEAITETYIPLLEMMNRLEEENVNYALTINISPPLAEMLNDKLLQKKYRKNLEQLLELSEKEIARTKGQPEFNQLARMYRDLFQRTHHVFCQKYEHNLLSAFKELHRGGNLELITSAATHGYMPLMHTPEAINAQIKTGMETHKQLLGERAAGFWLPECAFMPEMDSLLARNNIRYFIGATHAVLHADPRPRYGVYAPIYTPEGVACFGRDYESSKQVWSGNEGYPGDYDYREFYRDIGYDRDYDYISPYLPAEKRVPLGIKYYRITGETDDKDVYNPDQARKKAAQHAGNFMFNRQQQVQYLASNMDRKPIITAPYDAELFGHWWFEGPQWLEFLFKKIHFDQEEIEPITPSHYLNKYPQNQISLPSESSWGYKGYHEVWLNGSNSWIYRHLHEAELKYRELTKNNQQLDNREHIRYRALNQMGRELMLAQSSDWAFIMKTGTMVDYAEMRTKKHLHNFFKLAHQFSDNDLQENYLKKLEEHNNIFPHFDFKFFLLEESYFSNKSDPVYMVEN
ncbi:MAG: glycoside hydrolase family 57 protein [Halanaerobiaceae bacterium]